MNNIKLIKNYANALFETAHDQNKLEITLKQLKSIVKVVSASEASSVLCSPIVYKSNKINLIIKLTGSLKVDDIVKDFLLILIKNARETILGQVLDYYEQFLEGSKNIKMVKITSSKILKQNEKKVFKDYLENDLLKQAVKIKFEKDYSIIGGILVQYDNKVLDLSISGALKKIEDVSRKIMNI